MISNYNQTTSIAILPFKNLSSDNNLNYFALGFIEDLITDLSRYSSLQVISSHSTSALIDEIDDKEKIINSLRADYIVSGSFRQKGKDIRINTQLILSQDKSIIWSHRYEADIDSIFDIQDNVTEQLVSALQREIDVNLLLSSKRKQHTDLRAYEYWLMGMEELKKGNIEADNRARELFQQAIEVDPNYSRAYAGLSLSYFNEWSCQLWERWDYSQKGAYEYAQKAIELDDTNYMVLTVLGRLYLYKGDWEKAEHVLRKSLRLNANDTDNLIQIASCFVYLGYAKEAEILYQKALKLNPINTDWYFSFGTMLYFELGNFKKCIEQGLKTDFEKVMVDMTAFLAAAYYHLGDHEKMKTYWNIYLDIFHRKILRGNKLIEEEAINWVLNVNPMRGKTNLKPFMEYLRENLGIVSMNDSEPAKSERPIRENSIRKNGSLWEINYNGHAVTLPETKGLYDIYKLLSTPYQEIHCTELMGIPVMVGEENKVFDQKAKINYKSRLVNLKADIDEALEMNDQVRASHLQEEYDKLVDHLSKSLGLGGKTRKMSAPVEKARSAVTWRIRNTIKKISQGHAELGNHLSNSIKTGTFCSYAPEKEMQWIV